MRTPTARSSLAPIGAVLFGAIIAFASEAGTEDSAEALVKSTTDNVLRVLEKERDLIQKDPGRIYGIVDEYIIPNFDFERMSQRVLGKFWQRATTDQQDRFQAQFQTLLVRTYATALREYSNQKVEFLPSRPRGDGEVSVRTQIVQSGGPPISIDYELRKNSEQWKVYDVTIEGVSLVINYRSTFASEIRSNGLDALIERLAKHNQQKQ